VSLASCIRILQISDIHISEYHPESAKNLEEFCSSRLRTFLPHIDMIVMSGDLTDASPPLYSLTQRGQQIEDWKLLSKSFARCLKVAVPIFALRGNHDGFGVAGFEHETNQLYRDFSAELAKQRSEIKHTKFRVLGEHQGTQVIFKTVGASMEILILLDSVYNTGITRHFYGYFPEELETWLDAQMIAAAEAAGTDVSALDTTVVSHYPIGTYKRQDRKRMLECFARYNVRSFHGGHLHTILGRPMMTSWNKGDLVEHEIADFKSTQVVRVIDTENLWIYDFKADTTEAVSEFDDTTKMKLTIAAKAKPSGAQKQATLSPDKSDTTLVTVFKPLEFFQRTFFQYFGESIDSLALVAHACTVLLAVYLYIRNPEKAFLKMNVILVGLLPILPLSMSQVFPGTVGVNFWWGGVSHRGISGNDTVASDIILFDFKIFLALTILWLYGKFDKIAVRVIGGLCVLVAAGPCTLLNMHRGGLMSLVSLTLVWDALFWVYGPLGFARGTKKTIISSQ
jgi:hypothetical protein